MVWKPEEAQALLQKIYMAAFRVNDLLTLLRPDQWKMGDAERKSFSQTLDSLRDQLKTLEQGRSQLVGQPQNVEFADKTAAAIKAVRSSIEAVAGAVAQYESPAAADYKQAAESLSALQQKMASYIVSLRPPQEQPQAVAAPPSSEPARPNLTAKVPVPAAPIQTEKIEAAPSSPAPSAPAPMKPQEVLALLQKIYMAAFRVNDLLTLLQPDKWKMDEAERKSFSQTLDSLRDQLKTLEQWRYQLMAQPQNTSVADKTSAALDAVRTSVEAFARAVAQYESPGAGAEYKGAAETLSGLAQKLESYDTSLRAPVEQATATVVSSGAQPGKPGGGLQTEKIEAHAAPPPPATTVETPVSMKVYQARVLLHKVYVATFRVSDLLGVVHPERWTAPQSERDSFNREVLALRNHLKVLGDAREQFDEYPEDAYLGFQAYLAITPVIADLSRISRDVAQLEGPKLAADLAQPRQWLGETQHGLEPYLNFILQNREQAIRGFQADLASCQNTLNYALRPRPAVPMPNIMPALKGVRHPRPTSDGSAGHRGKTKNGRAQAQADGSSGRSSVTR
jgi:hypothetical protein